MDEWMNKSIDGKDGDYFSYRWIGFGQSPIEGDYI